LKCAGQLPVSNKESAANKSAKPFNVIEISGSIRTPKSAFYFSLQGQGLQTSEICMLQSSRLWTMLRPNLCSDKSRQWNGPGTRLKSMLLLWGLKSKDFLPAARQVLLDLQNCLLVFMLKSV